APDRDRRPAPARGAAAALARLAAAHLPGPPGRQARAVDRRPAPDRRDARVGRAVPALRHGRRDAAVRRHGLPRARGRGAALGRAARGAGGGSALVKFACIEFAFWLAALLLQSPPGKDEPWPADMPPRAKVSTPADHARPDEPPLAIYEG